jgi:hypothetical protein
MTRGEEGKQGMLAWFVSLPLSPHAGSHDLPVNPKFAARPSALHPREKSGRLDKDCPDGVREKKNQGEMQERGLVERDASKVAECPGWFDTLGYRLARTYLFSLVN